MEHGRYPSDDSKREAVDMPMRVVLHYRVNGVLRDWVCAYNRLDHIMEVCVEKGFEIVGIEDLA